MSYLHREPFDWAIIRKVKEVLAIASDMDENDGTYRFKG